MKITIQSAEANINLRFPTWLLFNRFTAGLAFESIKKRAGNEALNSISRKDFRKLTRFMAQTRHKFHGLELVNVECKNGEKVIIRL